MKPHVAYVLIAPPRPSETFILNEILALREHGVPTRLICLREDPDGDVPATLKEVSVTLSDRDRNLDVPDDEIQLVRMKNPSVFDREMRKATGGGGGTQVSGKEQQDRRMWRLKCAVRIASLCIRENLTHLHCHYANDPARVGVLVKKLTGVTCSFTGHAKDIFTMEAERLAKLMRSVDFAVSCTETGSGHLRSAAPDVAERVHCIHHGICADQWRVERHPESPALLLAVGRLTPKKGFPLAVEAMPYVQNARLEIIGEGRERGVLEAGIARHGLQGRVSLLGRLTQNEIRERFSRATALLMPSVVLDSNNQDGLANVVLEAMAAGLPVIVSDIPGLLEAVQDGDSGLVFPAGDSAALAQCIERLLGDQDLQDTLSMGAKARAEQFDFNGATRALLSLFHGCE